MNKVFKALTIVALGVLAVGAFAQAAGPQGGGVKGGVQGGGKGDLGKGGLKGNQKLEQQIWAKLTPPLNADQKAKLELINQKTMSSVKALKEKIGKGGDREALKPEIMKIQQERRDAIKALLTPEQQKSYMALMKEAMEKLRKERGEKPPIKKNG
jgi:Spy/CpxP family protein refolding chaperone